MLLAKLIIASMTRARRSVQISSFFEASGGQLYMPLTVPSVGPFNDPTGSGLQQLAAGADRPFTTELGKQGSGL